MTGNTPQGRETTNSAKKKLLPRTENCPCGSGKRYGACCQKKKIRYTVSSKGKIFREARLSSELVKMLKEHQERFLEVFGRKAGKKDLVLFDQFLSGFNDTEEILESISKKVGVQEQVIFATRRTGFMVGEHSKRIMSDIDYQEWKDAIDEYFILKDLAVILSMSLHTLRLTNLKNLRTANNN